MGSLIRRYCLALPAIAVFLPLLLADEKPKSSESSTLIVIDSSGKEQKIKGYRITVGTTRLSWLVAAEKKEADKKEKKEPEKKEPEKNEPEKKEPEKKPTVKGPTGPECLVFRDEMQIHFLSGVQSLIPVERIRSIMFDNEKQTMTVKVVTTGKPQDDVTLVGTTRFKGINKITIEAEVDKGDAGVAVVTYQGGILRGGIKGIRFPGPKADSYKPGRPAVITSQDQDTKKKFGVSDLQALYQFRSGRQKLLPIVHFRKTLKLDVAKMKTIAAVPDDSDTVWKVMQKDGDESNLSLLTTVSIDGQSASFIGFLGKDRTGYRLIPARRVDQVEFDVTEKPKEKKKADIVDF